MHTAEAVQAYKLNELWTRGRYTYDPHDHHGPVLLYSAAPNIKQPLSPIATRHEVDESLHAQPRK